MKPIIILPLIALALSSCGSTETPVGVGRGTNEMKTSPCAGNEVSEYSTTGSLFRASYQLSGQGNTPCPKLNGYKLRFQAI